MLIQVGSLQDDLDRKQLIIRELGHHKTENEDLRQKLNLKEDQLKKMKTHYESKLIEKNLKTNELEQILKEYKKTYSNSLASVGLVKELDSEAEELIKKVQTHHY